MPLHEYQRKRNFAKTPEPRGGRRDQKRGLVYVVQKHDASRLHYDFRLEVDGVLKSWAVPKGPSLDPAVKALAVQVEDHPLDYASFEGIIPQDEYGGGTVMVWDQGTWEPQGNAAAGLRAGKLKFTLHGKKLRGSWALVRMDGRAGAGGNNWLLIKHRDEVAKPAAKYDVLAREPNSVLTGRDLDAIAADGASSETTPEKPLRSVGTRAGHVASPSGKRQQPTSARIGRSSGSPTLTTLGGARKASFPRRFRPQLATLADEVPPGEGWLHEIKFDGYRILAQITGRKKVRLVTRNNKDWTDRFQVIADVLAELPVQSALLDGEVVSLDARGVSNFQQLQNSLKTENAAGIVYYIFDVPYLNGYDLTRVSLAERKRVLADVMHGFNPQNVGRLRYSEHIEGNGETVLRRACRKGLEGIIAKRSDKPYEQSRSANWIKVKCSKEQEFVIGGYSQPGGSRVGFGALLLGYYEGDRLRYAGRVGTGFTETTLQQLSAALRKRRTTKSPFADPPIGAECAGVTWVKPELVGEVEFTEWTDDGRLRHPSFHGLRDDKPAKQVVREKPKLASRKNTNQRRRAPPVARMPANETLVVAGIPLSHPDRVLYPEDNLTKRNVAEYYERIADWILPYVVGRPLTLVRCPGGYHRTCFFQKRITGKIPEAIHGVTVDVQGQPEEYVAIEDAAGLVGLVQLGVLEIHPWLARADNLERPDQLVFDLDPGEGVSWKDVVRGARELHNMLDAAGLTTFVRTTGGKGLHVVAPLVRRNTWDEIKSFAKSVADAMVLGAPDRYVATMSKAKRRGRIFIDYLRNQRGATAIASYSTRRRRGASVATPIAWDELTARTRPDKYTIVNLPKRLDNLANDPWAEFFTTRQSITREIESAFRT